MNQSKLESLKKKWKELGKEIQQLESNSGIKKEILAKDMPEGVLCQVRDSDEKPWKYRHYKNLSNSNIYPYATRNGIYRLIQFPTNPILPWLGESDKSPVHPDTKVTIWLRNGNNRTAAAKMYDWGWRNSEDDIVAYRVEEWA